LDPELLLAQLDDVDAASQRRGEQRAWILTMRPRLEDEVEARVRETLAAGLSVHAASVVGAHVELTPAPLRSRDEIAARRRSRRARGDRARRCLRPPVWKQQRGPDDDHEPQAGSEPGRHAPWPTAGRTS